MNIQFDLKKVTKVSLQSTNKEIMLKSTKERERELPWHAGHFRPNRRSLPRGEPIGRTPQQSGS